MMNGEETILELVEQLEHADSMLRENAAYLLGEIALEAKCLSEDTLKSQSSLIAINALTDSNIRSKVVVALLVKLKDKDPWVRGNAADALGKIGDSETAKELRCLISDTEGVVRYSAMEALGRIGSEDTVIACIEALNDSDWSVRLSAVKYLNKRPDERAEAALKKTIQDENKDVREYSMEALARLS